MQFNKRSLTVDEQINLLLERGLLIPDFEKAAHYLSHLNYYRLAAYWLPFEIDHSTHRFISGTSFEDVLNLYTFDRKLRLLMIDAIERIEVSVRSTWAHVMTRRYHPHCHLDRTLFKAKWNYDRHYKIIEKEVLRSTETFIVHLKQKYSESLPPLWATVEIMTFGQLSNWCSNTRHRQDRNEVAMQYGLDERILTSLLHHLTIVRNTCAHHARFWNREFPVIPKLPKDGLLGLSNQHRRKIYNTLIFTLHLMDRISPGHSWQARLLKLLDQHKIETSHMGFPDSWRSLAPWNHQAS